MRASSLHVGLALASLSGGLWFLSVTPFDLSALAWIASVPMLIAVDRAPSYRQALLLGWWAGVVETAGGFYWLIDTVQRFADFSWVAGLLVLIAFAATRAIIFLIFTAAIYAIRRRRRVPMTLLAPVVLVWCEFVVPQLFPCGQWISQAWHPLVIQISELTGPWGVTALLMMINGAIYDLLERRRAALYPAVAAAVVLAAALSFGSRRMSAIDALLAHTTHLQVGLVQPNIAYNNDGQFVPAEAARQLAGLQGESRKLEAQGAALVVWSEGSYPVALPKDFSSDFAEDSPAMIRRGLQGPVIVGADRYDDQHDTIYNSALLLDSAGRLTASYDKVHLLAFGEYMPGLDTFPWLKHVMPDSVGRFTPGAGPVLMRVKDPAGESWDLGPVICYEDILPGQLRDIGALHPNVLVNMTVDSWYGARTEPWEHLALSVFAAVEVRVALVRAVNSGISALVDPNGRLVRKTYADDPYREPRPPDGMLVSVPRMTGGDTLYVRWGNWFVYLCMAATIALGFKRSPGKTA